MPNHSSLPPSPAGTGTERTDSYLTDTATNKRFFLTNIGNLADNRYHIETPPGRPTTNDSVVNHFHQVELSFTTIPPVTFRNNERPAPFSPGFSPDLLPSFSQAPAPVVIDIARRRGMAAAAAAYEAGLETPVLAGNAS